MVENRWSHFHFDKTRQKMILTKRPNFFHEADHLDKNYKPEVLERVMIINSIRFRKADWPCKIQSEISGC